MLRLRRIRFAAWVIRIGAYAILQGGTTGSLPDVNVAVPTVEVHSKFLRDVDHVLHAAPLR